MPAWKKSRARSFRKHPTAGEAQLWRVLKQLPGVRGARGALPLGVRVHRQVPMLGFIADMYVPAARLVIEVDGGSHAGREARDRVRDAAMAKRGIRVVRVPDEECRRRPLAVLERIRREVEAAART